MTTMMSRARGDDGSATPTVLVVLAVLALLLVPFFLVAGSVGQSTAASSCTSGGTQQARPSATAQTSIPASYLALFEQTGLKYGIPWPVLAAIGDVESSFGANDGPSSAGALGPMQFLPSTWQQYGNGGDIMNPADAIPAAARLLLASGAPGNIPAAVFAYNHSADYVSQVLNLASSFATGGFTVSSTRQASCALAAIRQAPSAIAAQIITYAMAQIGKPYIFSGGPGGEITLNPSVCPAQEADGSNSSGATGVVQATLDPAQRCVAAAVLLYAAEQLGKPYQWGGTGPDAFDCSGLAMMAYRAAGLAIPRTSQEQWAAGPRVPPGREQPGDLVFFAGSDGTPQAPGHVGIVVGNGEMIEAYAAGFPIRVSTYGLSSSPPGDQVAAGFTRPG